MNQELPKHEHTKKEHKKLYPSLIFFVAFGLGLFWDLVMNAGEPGINLLLMAGAFILATEALAYHGKKKISLTTRISGVFLLLFSGAFALFTSVQGLSVAGFGILASITIYCLSLYGVSLNLRHPIYLVGAAVGDGFIRILDSLGILGKIIGGIRMLNKIPHAKKIIKGLLISVPILILFLILFTSADPVFADKVEYLLTEVFRIDDIEELILHTFIIGSMTLVFTGVLSAGFWKEKQPENLYGSLWKPKFGIESTVILTLTVILFGLFLAVQGTYLFGGEEAFRELGITYASYARRGFAELTAVAAIVLILGVTLRYFHGEKAKKALLALHTILIIETIFVLTSALMRLNLYIGEFGYTAERLYAGWFLISTGILLLVFLYHILLGVNQKTFTKQFLFLSATAMVVFSYSSPDALAMNWNIDLALEGEIELEISDFLYENSDEGWHVIQQRYRQLDELGILGPDQTAQEACTDLARVNPTVDEFYESRNPYYSLPVRKKFDIAREYSFIMTRIHKIEWWNWNYTKAKTKKLGFVPDENHLAHIDEMGSNLYSYMNPNITIHPYPYSDYKALPLPSDPVFDWINMPNLNECSPSQNSIPSPISDEEYKKGTTDSFHFAP